MDRRHFFVVCYTQMTMPLRIKNAGGFRAKRQDRAQREPEQSSIFSAVWRAATLFCRPVRTSMTEHCPPFIRSLSHQPISSKTAAALRQTHYRHAQAKKSTRRAHAPLLYFVHPEALVGGSLPVLNSGVLALCREPDRCLTAISGAWPLSAIQLTYFRSFLTSLGL